jgi:hypothetical protein
MPALGTVVDCGSSTKKRSTPAFFPAFFSTLMDGIQLNVSSCADGWHTGHAQIKVGGCMCPTTTTNCHITGEHSIDITWIS